jgi:phosphatidylglycerophosphatase C
MPANSAAAAGRCVAVFDLDGTLTWRDTLLPYLFGCMLRHPSRWLRLWRAPLAVLAYLGNRDRGLLKGRMIGAVMGGMARPDVDAWSDRYVGGLLRRGAFRPAALAVLEAHRAAGDHLILLSASPDLYVPRIGQLLGFERTVCTELEWIEHAAGPPTLDGALRTANRRGEEKCICLAGLRDRYGDLPVAAYGNSDSDLPHLSQADRAMLVNGTARARRDAARAGIAVADWT